MCYTPPIYKDIREEKIVFLILDNHPVYLEGVQNWLKRNFKNSVCISATDIRNAYNLLNSHHIDLVISDIELCSSFQNGFDFVKYIKKNHKDIKTIAFTDYYSCKILKQTKEVGFDTFIPKNISYNEFSEAIEKTLLEQNFVLECQEKILKKRKLYFETTFKECLYGLYILSRREIEILQMLIKTESREELAELLFISTNTVDTHIKNIRKKLELKSKKDLVLFAVEFQDEIKNFKY